VKCSPGLAASSGTATIGGDALKVAVYDIHCPLMGGPATKHNYLASSCRQRLDAASCRNKACEYAKVKAGQPRDGYRQKVKKVTTAIEGLTKEITAQIEATSKGPGGEASCAEDEAAAFDRLAAKHRKGFNSRQRDLKGNGRLAAVNTVSLTFSGDDAVAIRRFMALSLEQQGNPAEDVATVIELFMTGRMVVT